MSNKPALTLDDMLNPDGPTDAGYEAWARKRIERAVAEADANPGAGYTIEEVRAHFEAKFAAKV